MTEEHFNNGKTLIGQRDRIKEIKNLLQSDSNISIIDPLKVTDIGIYTQIRDFAKEILAKEEARLQAAFDALQEPEVPTPGEKI
jgi:hypothetical protein